MELLLLVSVVLRCGRCFVRRGRTLWELLGPQRTAHVPEKSTREFLAYIKISRVPVRSLLRPSQVVRALQRGIGSCTTNSGTTPRLAGKGNSIAGAMSEPVRVWDQTSATTTRNHCTSLQTSWYSWLHCDNRGKTTTDSRSHRLHYSVTQRSPEALQ